MSLRNTTWAVGRRREKMHPTNRRKKSPGELKQTRKGNDGYGEKTQAVLLYTTATTTPGEDNGKKYRYTPPNGVCRKFDTGTARQFTRLSFWHHKVDVNVVVAKPTKPDKQPSIQSHTAILGCFLYQIGGIDIYMAYTCPHGFVGKCVLLSSTLPHTGRQRE